jgi:hypothetical protein
MRDIYRQSTPIDSRRPRRGEDRGGDDTTGSLYFQSRLDILTVDIQLRNMGRDRNHTVSATEMVSCFSLRRSVTSWMIPSSDGGGNSAMAVGSRI